MSELELKLATTRMILYDLRGFYFTIHSDKIIKGTKDDKETLGGGAETMPRGSKCRILSEAAVVGMSWGLQTL